MARLRRVTILGDGGWGTCLGVLLSAQGHSVTLWGAFPDYVEQIRRTRENVKFLPGVKIPPEIKLNAQLSQVWEGAEVVVVAVPSQYLREVLQDCRRSPWEQTLVVSVVKGIEPETLLRMSQLAQNRMLSG